MRIKNKAARWRVGRDSGGCKALFTVQEPRGGDCACQRPICFVAPTIGALDKQFDWGLVVNSIAFVFEPAIEPAQLEFGEVFLQIDKKSICTKSKIHFADDIVKHPVRPRPDHEFAVTARHFRTSAVAHRAEVLQIGGQQ